MPNGKLHQTNVMLHAVIVFVTLFIIAAVFAVLFYVKAESYRIRTNDIKEEISRLASAREQNNLSRIVGTLERGKSYLGTMNAYLDELVSAITGKVPEETTAAVKVNDAKVKINETRELLGQDIPPAYGPDGIDLLETIKQLKYKLDTANQSARDMESQLNDIQDEFDSAMENFKNEERQLIEKINHYQHEADTLHAKYNELKELMERSTDEQVQSYISKLDKANEKIKQMNMDLLKAQTELRKTDESLQTALAKLEEIKPRPDTRVRAFLPDADIISVDLQMSVVYLDIGSDDHVYRGLTFSVYDRTAPIPEDGKGKAEIEVFSVEKKVSAAKINTVSKKNPIVAGDIAVNLIWDSQTSNKFVVAGEFDFDDNGQTDHDGANRVKQLIERWGGAVAVEATIETDFIILGTRPKTLPKPSRDQVELNPLSEQKYQASFSQTTKYDEILATANMLSIPVFNQKRFLYLIGYESVAIKSTPF